MAPVSKLTLTSYRRTLRKRQEMVKRYTDKFRRDAMRITTTSDLTRPQVSSDLGVGLSTLNRWAQKHQHDDLMSIAKPFNCDYILLYDLPRIVSPPHFGYS